MALAPLITTGLPVFGNGTKFVVLLGLNPSGAPPRPFPSYPAGIWQAPRADAASLAAGAMRLQTHCDRFLALNLSTQPEILRGGQTVVSVTGTVTGSSVTVSDYSVNTAGTMVGAWFLATAAGTLTVTFRAVLSDGTSVVIRTCTVTAVG